MSGPILYDFGGLVTAPGLLARNPASCIQADNWLFPAAGIMRKRRGWKLDTANPTGVVAIALGATPEMGEGVVGVFNDGTNLNLNYLWLKYGGAWALVVDQSGSRLFSNPALESQVFALGGLHYLTMCTATAGSFYPTPLGGTSRFEDSSIPNATNGTRAAGMPNGLPPLTYSMNAAVHTVLVGAPGSLVPDGSNVAYRVTWHRKSNNTVLGGAPTSRLVVRNIAGTSGYAAAVAKNVALRIPLPREVDTQNFSGVGTSYFWRLWRSRVSATDTADDELYQVAEAFVTAGDIAAGYASFTDQTPDTFLTGQARLHTNATNFPAPGLANGVLFSDNQPPVGADDATVFADCAWYASPTSRPTLLLNLLSPSFTAGNTIAVSSSLFGSTITLTAVAGVPVNPGDFTIVTGLGTLGLNIEATARNIVDAFNRAVTSSTVQAEAHYVSLGAQAPGQILFIGSGGQGANVSVVSATAGALFSPSIVTAQAAALVTQANTVFFSKAGRPDAVPPCNALAVGPSSARVVRLVPFRERLLVFTTAGLYQIDGTDYSNFTPSLVDSTIRILHKGGVCVVDDVCFVWATQGIYAIDDGGQRLVSEPIEPTERAITAQAPALSSTIQYLAGSAFALPDRNNHTAMFFYSLPTIISASAFTATGWLAFDVRERKWSTGSINEADYGFLAGAVQQSTGLLWVSRTFYDFSFASGALLIQRNARDATDYRDVDVSGNAIGIVSTAALQFQVPDTDSRQHWQQLQLEFENGEQTLYARPTTISLQWATDVVSTAAAVVYAIAAAIARFLTPTNYRRATRQRVVITHSAQEHCGVVAVNQTVSSVPAPRVTK